MTTSGPNRCNDSQMGLSAKISSAMTSEVGSWLVCLQYFKAYFLIGSSQFLEYKKAFAALGNTPTDDLYVLYRKKSPLWGITEEVLRDLPSVSRSLIGGISFELNKHKIYFALLMLNNPQKLSIASISIQQSSGRWLLYYIRMFFYELQDIRENLNSLKRMYAPQKSNVMEDGMRPYPCLTEKDSSSIGMSFVLR